MKKDNKPDPAAGRLSSIPGQRAGSRSASDKSKSNYDLGRLGIVPPGATGSAQPPKQPMRPDPVVPKPKAAPPKPKHTELRRLSAEMSPAQTGRASGSVECIDHASWLGRFERFRSLDRRALAAGAGIVFLVIVVSVWALCSGGDTNAIGPRTAAAEDGLATGNGDGPDSGADAPPRTDAAVANSHRTVSPVSKAAGPAKHLRTASARRSRPTGGLASKPTNGSAKASPGMLSSLVNWMRGRSQPRSTRRGPPLQVNWTAPKSAVSSQQSDPEAGASESTPPQYVPCPPDIRLTAIMLRPTGSVATINGRMLAVGGIVNEAKVISINGFFVEMELNDRRFQVGLNSGVEDPPSEDDEDDDEATEEEEAEEEPADDPPPTRSRRVGRAR